jgi:excisionase family DNA binding protein
MSGYHPAPATLLTVAEAARILKTSPAKVRRSVQAGILPAAQPAGKSMRIKLADVLALASSGQSTPAPAQRHICLFLREPQQFVPALLPLITAPLAAGATVVLTLDEAATRLDPFLVDPAVRQAYTQGRLRILEAETIYLSGGSFDTQTILDRLLHLSAATAPPQQPLILVDEMNWATRWQRGNELLRYEAELNTLLTGQPALSLICVYCASRYNGEMALALLQTHPTVYFDGIRRAGLSSNQLSACT